VCIFVVNEYKLFAAIVQLQLLTFAERIIVDFGKASVDQCFSDFSA
jgi:hypothetical protein